VKQSASIGQRFQSSSPARGKSVAKLLKARPPMRPTPMNFVAPFLRGNSADEIAFIAAMEGRFGSGTTCVPLGRARTGIHLLTRYAVRPDRPKVLLSPHTIPAVVRMVTTAGGIPCFFDNLPNSSNADLAQLSDLIDNETACVLLTHYHVIQEGISELRDICHARGAMLFDDCAISYGATGRDGLIGTSTDASVFSFSHQKFLNFYWGGLITTRDEELAKFVSDATATWPRLSFKHYMSKAKEAVVYDVATRPPFFNLVVWPWWLRRMVWTDGNADLRRPLWQPPQDHVDPTLMTRPAYGAFHEWMRKLPLVDQLAEHRRQIAQVYLARLFPLMLSHEVSAETLAGSTFMNFPVVVPNDARSKIRTNMMRRGFLIGKSMYGNLHESEMYAKVSGVSYHVSQMIRSTLYLPTHFGVSRADADEIAGTLEELLVR